MIKAIGVAKYWGEKSLFRHLAFHWQAPEIISITGANGSGKTTLLAMLAGIMPADAGEIRVLGHLLKPNTPIPAHLITYIPDDYQIYPTISGREWLAFAQSIHPMDSETQQFLLWGFGLLAHLDCKFADMSLGTAKKFLLTALLSSQTPILILDEASNGLDKTSLRVLCIQLQKRKTNSLIVLSCHDTQFQTQLGARAVSLNSLESA
jgi:ABC-type multidrug transport system ATPase subunit